MIPQRSTRQIEDSGSGPLLPRKKIKQRAVALIITLSAIVLLTVVIVAFFSKSLFNRQVSFSATSQYKADLLAHSAMDVIVGEVKDEITQPANNATSGVAGTYLPKSPTFAVPQKVGVASATGPVVKVSASGKGVNPLSTLKATDITIDKPSFNGRYISGARWFTSTQSSPAIGSQASLPTWMMVTRAGVALPSLANAADATKPDYVIGRFAYTVYDVSNLLDANVAGYPTALPFASTSTDIGNKSSATYADLKAFGVSANDVDKFVSWRNLATGSDIATFNEWASGSARSGVGASALAMNVARKGHTVIAAGDNGVVSRRDLVRNPDIPDALKTNVTHFSRTENAPSYIPDAPTAANPKPVEIRYSANATVTHYLDDGTTTTYTVKAGDPFLQRRFSLAKLAWLGADGPNAAAFNASVGATGRAQAIKDCFGLEWKADHWDYTSAAASTIKTLSTLAAGSKEPNFFEYLKAGLVEGSLGVTWPLTSHPLNLIPQQTWEQNKDLQVMQIGVNIIDCADTDNYPTTITFSYAGIPMPVHGVEDLPLLVGAYAGFLGTAKDDPANSATNDILNWGDVVMSPILFNPHRKSVTPSAGPTQIRLRYVEGSIARIWTYANTELGINAGNPISKTTPGGAPLAFEGNSLCSPIVVPSGNFENFRKDGSNPGFKPIIGGDATTATRLIDRDPDPTHDAVFASNTYTPTTHSFIIYQYPQNLNYVFAQTTGVALYLDMGPTQMVAEFLDAGGNWRIYSVLGGNEAFTSSGVGQTVSTGKVNSISLYGNAFKQLTAGQTISCNELVTAMMKMDPRTNRIGLGQAYPFYTDHRAPLPGAPRTHPAGSPTASGMNIHAPFDPSQLANGAGGLFPGLWVEGNKTAPNFTSPAGFAAATNVPDPDNIQRPADAWLNPATANLYRSTADDSCRPVILQRPFRTVGELGYVFRDSPWKTIDFFDNTSGDAALLDLFTTADQSPVVAGRSFLATTQSTVSQALFSGTAQTAESTSALTSPDIAAGKLNDWAYASGAPTANLPMNLSGLAPFLSSLPTGGTTGLDAIKYHREAVVRTLSNATQTRTWNLLIDVVAQSGRYPAKPTGLDNFIVEGEKRYWLSIAIDRYTGKVVDQQLEPAND